MFWIAFKGYNGGKAISLGAIEQAEATAYGMHGYPTAKEAEKKPNSVNAIEKPQVNAWIIAANDITGNPVKDLGNAAGSAASGVASGIINWISQKAIWERAGEVLVGVILIYVGVKASVTPASAPQAAKQGVGTTWKYAKTAARIAK